MISPGAASAPAAQRTEYLVGVAARVGDVAQDGVTAGLARVVDDDVTEAEQALQDGRRDGDILYVAQRKVARCARGEPLVDLDLRVGQGVAHGVAPQVLVGRPEQQRQPDWD